MPVFYFVRSSFVYNAYMEQIMIQVKDRTKIEWLIHLLNGLDFVEISVVPNGVQTVEKTNTLVDEPDFFALAGIWKDREVTLDSIRKQAWARQYE